MKEKTLSKKEKLFCHYFFAFRNARDAAAMSGYLLPFASGNMLLQKSQIKNEIKKISENYFDSDEVKAGLRRLAFGSACDCVKILFKDDISDDELETLDLFNISEIKKAKNGSIEIKFFDRLKALEHLSVCENTRSENSAQPFFEAIRKGANAIGGARLDE